MLLKPTTNTITAPSVPGTPGHPGRPYTPARCVTDQVSRCAWVPNPDIYTTLETISVTDPNTGVVESYSFPVTRIKATNNVASAGVPRTIYQCGSTPVTTCYPAQDAIPAVPTIPATPAQVASNKNYGWTNGRARSINPFAVGQAIRFKVSPASIGVFVGLAPLGSDTILPSSFAHGLMIDASGIKVFEHGVVVNTLATTWDAATEILIHRTLSTEGTVAYNIQGGSAYTSETQAAGTLYAYTALYSGGDTILEAGFEATTIVTLDDAVSVTLPAFVAVLAEDDYAEARATLPAFTASLLDDGNYEVVDTTLPAFSAILREASSYADVVAALPAFTAYLSGDEYVPAMPDRLDATLPAFSALLTDFTPGYETIFATLPAFQAVLSEGAYAEVRGTLPALQAYIDEGNPGEMWMVSALQVFSQNNMSTRSSMAFSSAVQLMDSWSYARTLTMELMSRLTVGSTLNMVGQYHAAWFSYVTVGDALRFGVQPNPDISAFYPDGGGTYVINVATGAAAIHNGLGPCVGFGTSNFGTNKVKHIPAFYVNVQGEPVVLKIKADDLVYSYTARNATTALDIQRIDIGRGLRASNWTMELSGGFEQLESVEAIPVVSTTRRI